MDDPGGEKCNTLKDVKSSSENIYDSRYSM